MDNSDVFVCFLPYYLATPRPTDATTFRIANTKGDIPVANSSKNPSIKAFVFLYPGWPFIFHPSSSVPSGNFLLPSDAALLFQLVIRLHATGGVSQQLWLHWFSIFFLLFNL